MVRFKKVLWIRHILFSLSNNLIDKIDTASVKLLGVPHAYLLMALAHNWTSLWKKSACVSYLLRKLQFWVSSHLKNHLFRFDWLHHSILNSPLEQIKLWFFKVFCGKRKQSELFVTKESNSSRKAFCEQQSWLFNYYHN